ncbi:MAG: hypothetical protein A2921_00060 [Candidatus Magasanikbacteria bacterium RIFCSPLOWO2_01_FULL_43_20b]|uniref:Uncharacterized protein n=1 Tax=Candidatus Magasanikbacteria bacterium RIFCSPLOWO2_12_FULL_43_12 TaxID=1798692 RepID=A0A1F6MTM0_9BACT|nr:MAG: hypothetical protein A3C74_00945 [Candidatus Magasanikbacteria bacterium RIFCSPHIGHO2_02_FULL_44_13]OGH72657.1 MAG: hypothetical protein A3I93_02320 [Candidatus Magasanikbacteria bacterium RIFCSPLOWO2_02_FULL_43_22]OGH72960.1 MAG: hypothetical protein A2921_00060 [Candidatus Magasanikbacteria bacterium RIFCSPLOWO2_01_FULL_43_20b]OGH75014.1 MAG: hypothetical protein A3G00_01525 [Candidatus Magasanikbacteria bacterium RIFCSPLOWO2_12_FULL_43_12]
MFAKPKTPDKFSRYTDPTGEFSNRELKLGVWYLKHKLLLQKIGLRLLIVWCVVTVGYSFGYWLYYFSYGYFQDQKMAGNLAREIPNHAVVNALFNAKDLQVGRIEVYNSVSELFDFTAQVKNPNSRNTARVTYKFVYNGGETALAQTMLLPMSERPIVYFGQKSDIYPTAPRLVIEKVEWKRVGAEEVPDIGAFLAERLNFTMENFVFTKASQITGTLNHQIEFDLFNDSAYGYWEPKFYVELIDGVQTVGTIYLVVPKFKAGEMRHIDLRSLVDTLDVSEVKIWPAFNPFDQAAYLKVE